MGAGGGAYGRQAMLLACLLGQEEARMAGGAEGTMEIFDKLLMALEDAKRVIRDEIADKVPRI
jgi:hypothetical protein